MHYKRTEKCYYKFVWYVYIWHNYNIKAAEQVWMDWITGIKSTPNSSSLWCLWTVYVLYNEITWNIYIYLHYIASSAHLIYISGNITRNNKQNKFNPEWMDPPPIHNLIHWCLDNPLKNFLHLVWRCILVDRITSGRH